MVLFTLRHAGGPVTLDVVAREFKLEPEELGPAPLVIDRATEPAEYVVRLPENAIKKMKSHGSWEVQGPYEDSEIGAAGATLRNYLFQAVRWMTGRRNIR